MDHIVQCLVLNREILALGPGVVAAQAAHAAVAGYLAAASTAASRSWAECTCTKIVLAVDDEGAPRRLAEEPRAPNAPPGAGGVPGSGANSERVHLRFGASDSDAR
jgi:hypothetical protein